MDSRTFRSVLHLYSHLLGSFSQYFSLIKPTQVLHRKRNDLAKHIKYQKRAGIDSRLFKGFIGLEAMTGVVAPKLAIRRKTMPIAQGANENNPQAPETKPMIFICTTLWHEEGNCHHR